MLRLSDAGHEGWAGSKVYRRPSGQGVPSQRNNEVGVRRIFHRGVLPENASDALRWDGTSEAEIQAAAATLGRRTASLRRPTPRWPAVVYENKSE